MKIVTLKKGASVTLREGVVIWNRGNFGITIGVESAPAPQRTQDETNDDAQATP